MRLLENVLLEMPEFIDTVNAVMSRKYPVAVTGLSAVHKAHFIHTICSQLGEKAIVIASDEAEAKKICEDIDSLGGKALFYPGRDLEFKDITGRSREFEHQRIHVLSDMLSGNYTAVIGCADAFMQLTVPPEALKKHHVKLAVGQSISINDLCQVLIAAGYERAEQVEGQGQFSVRGGILDLFAPDATMPVRAEFWGDEIDTLSEFDLISQRRTESVDFVEIMPSNEIFTGNLPALADKIEKLADSLKGKAAVAKQNLISEADDLRGGKRPGSFDKYISLIYDKPATVFDYHKGLLFVSEHTSVKERVHATEWQMGEDIKDMLESGILCKNLTTFLLESDALYTRFSKSAIFLDSFARAYSEPYAPKVLVNVTALRHPVWMGEIEVLIEDVKAMLARSMCVCIMAGSANSADYLCEALRKNGIPADRTDSEKKAILKKVFVTTGTLSAGFEYANTYFGLISAGRVTTADGGIRNSGSVQRKKSKHPKGKTIFSLSELTEGDYVVHSTYGIGIFEGVVKRDFKNDSTLITREYIKIKYAGSDTVYIPVTQMDLVTKYVGGKDNANIKLNKLGSDDWQKAKNRARASVKDIADKLTALYAARMQQKGFAFERDNEWQRDFELKFDYIETDDQLRCVDEIKRDMESTVPMERLLCGDVGFGKTEVALRAAFKCVTQSKQVAFLVPTTLLARQHYQTILKRMEGFPVNVEMLTRYTTAAQKTKLLKRVKSGEVDILVGTHSIIQKSVEFRDLGLVIIDEEQRFGVEQKEKLKEKFTNVDILILSATPIPRTLNMALSGMRDMSVLEEAPQDRHPVQTYVLEYDDGIVAEAIKKELRRGGQVYYLFNNTQCIDVVAAKIAQLVPEAKIGVAHGKMSEEKVNEIWRMLLDNEINVLVSTTIIETGVDVPNVNTLIIENAHKFGLSQLHQIRGRVGRSSRRAYAYLTFPRDLSLTDIAYKRLNAIREFTEFGSGFKIAMRDLELRGAGDILGAQQHGHIEAVGYEMYLSLLEEAMREKKGEEYIKTELDCTLDIQISAYIPEKYISSLKLRLDMYRRIAAIRDSDDASDVIDELIDRFGEPPAAVAALVDIASLRARAARLGIFEVTQSNGNLIIKMITFDMDVFNRLIKDEYMRKIKVVQGNQPCISVELRPKEHAEDILERVVSSMEGSEQ